MVVQQERQFASNVLVASVNSANSNSNRSSTICTFAKEMVILNWFVTKKHGFPNQESKNLKDNGNRKVCAHCRRNGYIINTCYKKHGYPHGYKFTNKKTAQINNVGVIVKKKKGFSKLMGFT